MTRLIVATLTIALALGACTETAAPVGTDGKPLPQVFRINTFNASKIPFRMLDSINALRSASGLQTLGLNKELTAAAATHARDMSVQNRPWHFGSDGSSPIDRVARTGYAGGLTGENISETYENDLETLAAWLSEVPTRDVIMNPDARNMGVAWFQEPNGKIWWALVLGS